MIDNGLILYQFSGAWGLSSFSPFCIKLECWLRLAGIAYESRVADMRRAPKGKIPFVRVDGQLLGDSQLIVEHLTAKHGIQLDAGLGADQVALAHLIRRTVEEAFYFALVAQRWRNDSSFAVLRGPFAAAMPKFIGPLILPLVRRSIRKKLQGQGTGRHSDAEYQAMAIADVAALAQILGDQRYMLGDTVRSVDATVFAHLLGCGAFPEPSPLRDAVRGNRKIAAYLHRIADQFWQNSPIDVAAAGFAR